MSTRDFEVCLGAIEFKCLNMEDNLSLIADISEEEIQEAVWQCDGSKSPGPDHYNFNFIKQSWGFMKNEIVVAVALFLEMGVIPKGCNASFIALLAKVRDLVKLNQYIPISLEGALHKIISEVLSNKIKNVLSSVINESQLAFLKDRGMLDSVLMANEVVEDLRRNKRSGMCLKVDYEKAYDSVRWEFLYDML